MRLLSLLWIAAGVALLYDGYSFLGRSLFLENYLPFGIHYTTFKFAMADRSTIELVAYCLCAVGAVLTVFGVYKLLKRG